jgi:hypothetical protein
MGRDERVVLQTMRLRLERAMEEIQKAAEFSAGSVTTPVLSTEAPNRLLKTFSESFDEAQSLH